MGKNAYSLLDFSFFPLFLQNLLKKLQGHFIKLKHFSKYNLSFNLRYASNVMLKDKFTKKIKMYSCSTWGLEKLRP